MKSVLIVGATSAIAKQCARVWADRGEALFLVARDSEKLDMLAKDLLVRGASEVHSLCLDLSLLEDHSQILQKARETIGDIDIALIAHGSLSDQSSCQQSVDETLREIRINALSVVSLMTLFANEFESKQHGTIAVISSVAGDRGRQSNYVYGSSKAMVTTFASGLRQRLHKKSVHVLTIKPGFVDTPMTAEFKKGVLWAKPQAVARLIIKAIDRKRDEIYAPGFWRYIMLVIKTIPSFLFKRTNI